jgi:multiple sugar transport system permease protein
MMASATLPASTAGIWQRVWYKMQHGSNWIYLLPALIFFIGYQIYPIVRVFIISFTDYHFLRTRDPVNFVGLELRHAWRPAHVPGLDAPHFTACSCRPASSSPASAIMVDRVKARVSAIYKLIPLISP